MARSRASYVTRVASLPRAAVAELGEQRAAAHAIGISEPGLSLLLKDGPRRR
jgi:hypothetical protein